jgi:hypothetical protein
VINERTKQTLKSKYDILNEDGKLRILNSINDQMITLMGAGFGTLPLISGISAAMLIVATFNSQLLPLTFLVKILISILIFIVPLSLVVYLVRIRLSRKLGEELLELYQGFKPDMGKGFWNFVLNSSPFIFAGIIFLIVIIILFLIWH